MRAEQIQLRFETAVKLLLHKNKSDKKRGLLSCDSFAGREVHDFSAQVFCVAAIFLQWERHSSRSAFYFSYHIYPNLIPLTLWKQLPRRMMNSIILRAR